MEDLKVPSSTSEDDDVGNDETSKELQVFLEAKENPRTLSKFRKWVITIIVSTCGLNVTALSSTYSSAMPYIERDMHVSAEVATVGLTTYLFGMGLGPMVLAPLSEFYGRRIIYIVSFAFFFALQFATAFSPTIEGILIPRFFQGIAGSAFLSVAGGTVGDMFEKENLGLPMLLFTIAPFIGPSLGPVVGGFISTNVDWRWIFWVFIIWTFFNWLLLVLFVKETYEPVLCKWKAQKLRKSTGLDTYYAPLERMDKTVAGSIIDSCGRPPRMLIYEPMILGLCIYSAILLGILYLFFRSFELVFGEGHHMRLQFVGLCFLGMCVGLSVSAIGQPLLVDRLYRYQVKKNNGIDVPEYRLPPAMWGGVLVCIGLFWFAWTTYSSVHWIVPIIASGFYSCGMLFVFNAVFTYKVGAYKAYSASALATNSFMRSTIGCVFPLFAVQMYDNLGYQWASCLLAFLTLACLPMPFLFYRYGAFLRSKSRFHS